MITLLNFIHMLCNLQPGDAAGFTAAQQRAREIEGELTGADKRKFFDICEFLIMFRNQAIPGRGFLPLLTGVTGPKPTPAVEEEPAPPPDPTPVPTPAPVPAPEPFPTEKAGGTVIQQATQPAQSEPVTDTGGESPANAPQGTQGAPASPETPAETTDTPPEPQDKNPPAATGG